MVRRKAIRVFLFIFWFGDFWFGREIILFCCIREKKFVFLTYKFWWREVWRAREKETDFARHVYSKAGRRAKPSVNQHYGICMLFTLQLPSTFVWIILEINQRARVHWPSQCWTVLLAVVVVLSDSQEGRQMAPVCPLYTLLHHSKNVSAFSLSLWNFSPFFHLVFRQKGIANFSFQN